MTVRWQGFRCHTPSFADQVPRHLDLGWS
jgi:hypothetical protein